MKLRTITIAAALLPLWALAAAPPAALRAQAAVVSVTENATSFTLSNGIVTARILKSNGDIRSLQYKGIEILTDKSGHAGGYWSHDTTGGKSLGPRLLLPLFPMLTVASIESIRDYLRAPGRTDRVYWLLPHDHL